MSETKPKLNRAKLADSVMLVVIVALFGWAAFSFMQPAPLERLVGQPAPQFKLRTMSGEVVGLPDHEGKVVLLDFWATWCDPCFRQMPAVHDIAEQYGDEVAVLAINVDDPTNDRKERMKQFLVEAKVEVDSLIDDGTVAAMYGVEGIPALVVIDPSGKVYWSSSGVHKRETLVERVEEAKEEGS